MKDNLSKLCVQQRGKYLFIYLLRLIANLFIIIRIIIIIIFIIIIFFNTQVDDYICYSSRS